MTALIGLFFGHFKKISVYVRRMTEKAGIESCCWFLQVVFHFKIQYIKLNFFVLLLPFCIRNFIHTRTLECFLFNHNFDFLAT